MQTVRLHVMTTQVASSFQLTECTTEVFPPLVRCPKPELAALKIACLRYARRQVLTATSIVPNFYLMTAHDGVSVWPVLLNFEENTSLNRKRSIRTHLFWVCLGASHDRALSDQSAMAILPSS